ncbi:comK family protein [Staphylococcus piscifermentans]|uniref:Competence protein ComK n=1 Tax=Staphylococcus piscifermentans TaxID=70258 RepID=A0A239TZ26_9STAP|nr:competence protein ComK [Staphylococcus piscifermentans]RTX86864.1 hypothetical protein CD139_00190 [Staphylococcus piscifermentans]GEP84377.1 competence protein ComK [Staphylococcus piscifermentans]SNV02980.1 comK family protein [Staphylococcus piscifermentans]
MGKTRQHLVIIYMKSYPHQCFQVECVYNIFRKLTKHSIKKYLDLLIRMHPLPKNVFSSDLKQLLNIRKHLPLIVDSMTILFPIKHPQTDLQYFINGMQIASIKPEQQHTRLTFSNGQQLVIHAPYPFIHHKWLECIFLHHFMFVAHD